MTRPRILLVPEITELQWAIRPQLEEWAEVASYDPPGIGDEPPPEDPTPALIRERFREAIIERGLAEVDRLGWDKFFIAVDSWGQVSAAHIAVRRRGDVLGMALGHASLSLARSGERPVFNPEVFAAVAELINKDTTAFLRHGIPQATHGSVDEELAEKIVERIPAELLVDGWEALTADEPFGEILVGLDCPMLLAKHQECLMSTDEGFEDAVAALPDAETIVVPDAPCVDAGFAAAVRRFCESVISR
jgi:pimeloyl-ACP methyl ester carboxylesterase